MTSRRDQLSIIIKAETWIRRCVDLSTWSSESHDVNSLADSEEERLRPGGHRLSGRTDCVENR